MNRSLKEYLLITLKGMGMGAADVVPGVSGGTIAFITGIYQELIDSIKSVNIRSLKLFFTGKFKEFWSEINGNFLLAVVIGIGISVLSLAKGLKYLLENHAILIWSFFFGLIVASAIYVGKDIKQWKIGTIISMIAGAVIAYFITIVTPAEAHSSYAFVFLSGSIAICAMILPGISGSFILVLLGMYKFILDAVSGFNLPVIAVFMVGAALGIILFSNLLSWLLKRYYDLTIALLAGFMIGSLNKVWPWKETVETFIDRHGEVKPLVEENILPTSYETISGLQPQLAGAIGLAALGFALIFIIEGISKKLNK
jgi:putative membrane protein